MQIEECWMYILIYEAFSKSGPKFKEDDQISQIIKLKVKKLEQ